MGKFSQQVQDHYHRSNLYEDILNLLKTAGIDLNQVKRSDISTVDEFHVRGAEVSQELAATVDLYQKEVLDVGCGIGGPARMLADVYDCQVTGIDLSEAFIRTAEKLSALVGLGNKTRFINANATQLPFDANTFEVVWTQHVQMNIQEKERFYSEIRRVLLKEGIFLYYDIFKKGSGAIPYPMPWAENSEISFLAEVGTIEVLLKKLGFKRIQSKDQTEAGIAFFETLLNKLQKFGPPQLGLNLVMGTTTQTKIGNLLEALRSEGLMLQSGVYAIHA
ncbi:MAG: class I SAM-dependent methyltransferase [Bacteroidota bacterium]